MADPIDGRARLGSGWPVAVIGLGVCLYGTGPVLIRASSLDAAVFSFWRLLLAIPVLIILVRGRLSGLPMPESGRSLRVYMVAGTALASSQLLVMSALDYTTVAEVSLLAALAPLGVGIIARLWMNERLGAPFWSSAFLAVFGIWYAVGAASLSVVSTGQALGRLLALLSVVGYSVFVSIAAVARRHVRALDFLLGCTLVATIANLAYLSISQTVWWNPAPRQLLFVVGVVAGGGTAGHLAFMWGLRWTSPTLGTAVRLLQPVVAAFLAFLFLGEPVTASQATGALIALLGVGLAVASQRPRGGAPSP